MVAGGLAMVLPAQLGIATTLAVICAVLGAGWLAALTLAAGRSAAPVELAGVSGGVVAAALLVAAGGGLASPMAVMLIALPVEISWISGSRRGVRAGIFAAVAAVVLQFALGAWLPGTAVAASAWHWLVPLAYAATLVPRLSAFFQQSADERGEIAASRLEALIGGALLNFNRNGEVVSASAGVGSLLGVPAELLLGGGLFDRVHVADRVQYLCAVSEMASGAESRQLRVRLRRARTDDAAPGESYRLFFLNLARQGEGDGFVAALRDAAELADLSARLETARDDAEREAVARGRAMAAVSHELRTPLNSIIGFCDGLLHGMFGALPDKRQREYVGVVRDAGNHLLSIVDSMLETSRVEFGNYAASFEQFRFRDAVDACHAMMSMQAAAKAIDFSIEEGFDTGTIRADRRAVRQMLINLVSNALKFTPQGGRVSVGGRQAGGRLSFWVADTGIGIAEQDLADLGKPFTQLHSDCTRRFEGTGLGLSLVKGLVALHGGTMIVESAPGEGTTVTISLPVDGTGRCRTGSRGVLVAMPARKVEEDSDATLRKTA